MRYFLIMNPNSGDGKSKRYFPGIFSLLEKEAIHYEYRISTSIKDIFNYSVYANKKAFDVIVAVGGDGTINAVLNGFFDDKGKTISDACMGVIYTGTSPDFCKSYHIPVRIEAAVQNLIENNRIQISIGTVFYSGNNDIRFDGQAIEKHDNPKVAYFACCANIGMGASVAKKANGGARKYLGDFLGTLYSLLVTLLKYKANQFTIVADGEKRRIDKLYNLSVGKTRFIASGIKVHNSLGLRDRKLYCLVVRNFNLVNFLTILKNVYSGKKIKNTSSLYLDYVSTIEVYGNYINPEIEIDGDPLGYLPCKIKIAANKLELIAKVN